MRYMSVLCQAELGLVFTQEYIYVSKGKTQLYLNFFAALWFSQICAPFWELPVIIEIASESALIASCFGILWWVGASFYDPYPHSVLYILQVSFSRYLSSKISDKPWKIAFHGTLRPLVIVEVSITLVSHIWGLHWFLDYYNSFFPASKHFHLLWQSTRVTFNIGKSIIGSPM